MPEKKEKSTLDTVLEMLAKDSVNTKDVLSKLQKAKDEEPRMLAMKELIAKVDKLVDITKPLKLKIKGDGKMTHRHMKGRETIQYKGFVFELRNVSNFDVPFVEMQDGDVTMNDDFFFTNKLLTIYPNNVCARRFLLMSNRFGKMYDIVDEEKAMREAAAEGRTRKEAMSYIDEMDDMTKKAALLYASDKSWSEIATIDEDVAEGLLVNIAITNPMDILEVRDNPKVQHQALYYQAEMMGVLRFDDKKSAITYKNGQIVTNVSDDEDPSMKFAWFIHNNKQGKGTTVLNNLKEKLA